MDPKPNHLRPRPRLDRRNAIKNIDYDASSSSLDNSSPTLTTCSLDDHRTSFRVKGVDGEFDRICRTLGLSGPEDFAIPAAAWEARKARSSSDFNQPKPRQRNYNKVESSFKSFIVGPNAGIIGDKRGPPPVQLVVDKTWNTMKSFAPDSDEDSLNSPVGASSPSNKTQTEGFDGDVVGENQAFSSSVVFVAEAVNNVVSLTPNGKFKISILSWQKGGLLGSGSFGTVYEGFTDDGFFFAVKEVSLLDQGDQGKQSILQLQQEISLLSQFEHENIVQYYGTDKDENKLYIFLELVTKGSLANLYQKYHLGDSQVSAYTKQILRGLKYLHEQNVVHRDIKCTNILVDVSGSVKLADFGLAKATKMNDVKSCKGTPKWMAPEVVKSSGYGLAADIWSLGCTVLEMLTRGPPYSNLEGIQALFKIGRGEPPPVPGSLSRDAQDFILQCLQVNPNLRPTAVQLLDHPFLKRPLQTLQGLPSPHYNSRKS